MPRRLSIGNVALDSFSVERALTHVKAISKEPHFVGSPAHNEVRQYIVTELNKMGLETQIQEGYNAGVFDNLCKVQNIIARIKGTEGNKSLILLAHYDSSPNSSLGASDDASGVAVILETVRGYLAGKEKPKNDIIILFSDAEELGLNGAQLFVSKHTWAKEVGLVLNFEAGGSGGVSSMLIETNGGNSRMIKNFVKANPKYPFANSLVYTIYKLLPSDMDLTVFRKDGNIEGFNFGCFDDKFDYHTKTDNYERLDRNTLEHQGSYSMPVLKYFAKENLNDLKSKDDFVYFNFPFLRLVFYPYSWTVPMLLIAIAAFVGLLIWGRKKAKINLVEVGKGFIPFILSLIICCAIGYFSWPILKGIYPHYNNIQYPFTYNGHSYIAAVIFLSIGICFLLYSKSNIFLVGDL
jgi:hypothetical protein